MPPKKLQYSDEEAAQKSHGHLIAAAKKWGFCMKICCDGKQGQMLGGHNSCTNTMYVRCLCGDVKAHKAHESTPVYDLEDWVFKHCQSREADLEDMEDEEIDRACMEGCTVISMDAVPGVPSCSGMTLRELVRLTCMGYGGPDLAGLSVWVYWYDQPHDAEDSVDAVGKGLAVLRSTEHKNLGVWYKADLVGVDEDDGNMHIHYPADNSNHKICAPLCQVHWGAKPPLSGVLANSSKAVARAPPRLLLPPPTPVAQQQQQKLSTQPGQFQKDGPGLIGGKRQLAGSGKEPGAAKGGEWAAGSAMEGHTGGRRLDGTSTDQEAEASLPPLSPEGFFPGYLMSSPEDELEVLDPYEHNILDSLSWGASLDSFTSAGTHPQPAPGTALSSHFNALPNSADRPAVATAHPSIPAACQQQQLQSKPHVSPADDDLAMVPPFPDFPHLGSPALEDNLGMQLPQRQQRQLPQREGLGGALADWMGSSAEMDTDKGPLDSLFESQALSHTSDGDVLMEEWSLPLPAIRGESSGSLHAATLGAEESMAVAVEVAAPPAAAPPKATHAAVPEPAPAEAPAAAAASAAMPAVRPSKTPSAAAAAAAPGTAAGAMLAVPARAVAAARSAGVPAAAAAAAAPSEGPSAPSLLLASAPAHQAVYAEAQQGRAQEEGAEEEEVEAVRKRGVDVEKQGEEAGAVAGALAREMPAGKDAAELHQEVGKEKEQKQPIKKSRQKAQGSKVTLKGVGGGGRSYMDINAFDDLGEDDREDARGVKGAKVARPGSGGGSGNGNGNGVSKLAAAARPGMPSSAAATAAGAAASGLGSKGGPAHAGQAKQVDPTRGAGALTGQVKAGGRGAGTLVGLAGLFQRPGGPGGKVLQLQLQQQQQRKRGADGREAEEAAGGAEPKKAKVQPLPLLALQQQRQQGQQNLQGSSGAATAAAAAEPAGPPRPPSPPTSSAGFPPRLFTPARLDADYRYCKQRMAAAAAAAMPSPLLLHVAEAEQQLQLQLLRQQAQARGLSVHQQQHQHLAQAAWFLLHVMLATADKQRHSPAAPQPFTMASRGVCVRDLRALGLELDLVQLTHTPGPNDHPPSNITTATTRNSPSTLDGGGSSSGGGSTSDVGGGQGSSLPDVRAQAPAPAAAAPPSVSPGLVPPSLPHTRLLELLQALDAAAHAAEHGGAAESGGFAGVVAKGTAEDTANSTAGAVASSGVGVQRAGVSAEGSGGGAQGRRGGAGQGSGEAGTSTSRYNRIGGNGQPLGGGGLRGQGLQSDAVSRPAGSLEAQVLHRRETPGLSLEQLLSGAAAAAGDCGVSSRTRVHCFAPLAVEPCDPHGDGKAQHQSRLAQGLEEESQGRQEELPEHDQQQQQHQHQEQQQKQQQQQYAEQGIEAAQPMPLALQVTCSTSAKKDPSGDNNIGGGGPGGVGAGGTASASQGAPPAPVKHSPSPEPSDPAGALGADKHGEERPVTYTCTTYSCGPWGLEVYQPMQKNRENAHHHHQPQQQHQQDQQDKQPAQQPPEQQQQEHLQEQKQDDALFAEGRVFVRLVANMSFCLGSITVASEDADVDDHDAPMPRHVHLVLLCTLQLGGLVCGALLQPSSLSGVEGVRFVSRLLRCMRACSALICTSKQLQLMESASAQFPGHLPHQKLL